MLFNICKIYFGQPPCKEPGKYSVWDGKYHFKVENKVIVNQEKGIIK